MESASKYLTLLEALRGDIIGGKYPPGSKLPSEEALCRKWQVSRPTVGRAIKDLQSAGLVWRKAGSGTFVSPQAVSSQVVLGLLVGGLGRTEIIDPICAQITQTGQARGCRIFPGVLSAGQNARELALEWARNGVRGVFFAPWEHEADREKLNFSVVESFQETGLEVVLLDREVADFPRRSDWDLVGLDNFQAGYDIGLHLVQKGTKRVAFVARPDFPSSSDLRLAGVRESLVRNADGSVTLHTGPLEDTAFIKRVCDTKPDAVVCSNDLSAALFLNAAASFGRYVPRDFLLAGFDDVIYASLLAVPLTTIRQPCPAIGAAAIEAMLSRLQTPSLPARFIQLRGTLIERESTNRA